MSELKRYLVNWHMEQLYEHKDGDVVMFSDFEKANYKAELYDEVWQKATEMGFMNVTMALAELAALREELDTMTAAAKGIRDAWREDQQRLTAAEQRNAELVELLRDAAEYVRHPDYDWHMGFIADVDAALKPTESGASE